MSYMRHFEVSLVVTRLNYPDYIGKVRKLEGYSYWGNFQDPQSIIRSTIFGIL